MAVQDIMHCPALIVPLTPQTSNQGRHFYAHTLIPFWESLKYLASFAGIGIKKQHEIKGSVFPLLGQKFRVESGKTSLFDYLTTPPQRDTCIWLTATIGIGVDSYAQSLRGLFQKAYQLVHREVAPRQRVWGRPCWHLSLPPG